MKKSRSKKSRDTVPLKPVIPPLGFLDCELRDVKQEVMFDSARTVARKQRTDGSVFGGNKRKHNYLSFILYIVFIDKYTYCMCTGK
jgi:hypothetical protein